MPFGPSSRFIKMFENKELSVTLSFLIFSPFCSLSFVPQLLALDKLDGNQVDPKQTPKHLCCRFRVELDRSYY